MPLLVRYMYNCRFPTAPHSALNDGTPSPQNTKNSTWPPFNWNLANMRIWKGTEGISSALKAQRLLHAARRLLRQWRKWKYSLWPPTQLTGLNRTWGSAYLSARRTCRLGVLSAGRSAGRKYGLIRHPPLVLAEKTAGGTAVLSAGRSAGRRYGRTFGRPARPAESPAVPSAGRKYGRTSGWPNWPAESTAVPPAGRVGRPKVRFNPSPPLVVIPPYTNNPPPIY